MQIPEDIIKKLIAEKYENVEQYYDKAQKEKKNDEIRREIIFSWFKNAVNREMTETEYQRYLIAFAQAEKGYNLFKWIEENIYKLENTQ